MRLLKLALLAAVVVMFCGTAWAQLKPPSGPHFNLNIIGVEKGKKPAMNNSDRHTIFVALGKFQTTETDIWLTPGDFAVCDGNGFDDAYDCEGNDIGKTGAVFQLPCNLNVPADITCDAGLVTAYYEVWARALGKPGGQAWMTLCAYDTTDAAWECSSSNVFLVRAVGKGNKPSWQDVTNQLTMFVDPSGLNAGQKVALFSGDYEDFYWQYNNNGLKLAQIRFYVVPEE